MKALHDRYKLSIPVKINALKSLIQAVEEDACEETWRALFEEVHKIKGSAGCFGFDEVSIVCAEMANRLKKHLKGKERISGNWKPMLHTFLDTVQEHFNVDPIS